MFDGDIFECWFRQKNEKLFMLMHFTKSSRWWIQKLQQHKRICSDSEPQNDCTWNKDPVRVYSIFYWNKGKGLLLKWYFNKSIES